MCIQRDKHTHTEILVLVKEQLADQHDPKMISLLVFLPNFSSDLQAAAAQKGSFSVIDFQYIPP